AGHSGYCLRMAQPLCDADPGLHVARLRTALTRSSTHAYTTQASFADISKAPPRLRGTWAVTVEKRVRPMTEEPRRRAGRRTSPSSREDADSRPPHSAGDEVASIPRRTSARKPRAASPGALSDDAPPTGRAIPARAPRTTGRTRAGGAA